MGEEPSVDIERALEAYGEDISHLKSQSRRRSPRSRVLSWPRRAKRTAKARTSRHHPLESSFFVSDHTHLRRVLPSRSRRSLRSLRSSLARSARSHTAGRIHRAPTTIALEDTEIEEMVLPCNSADNDESLPLE